MDEGEISNRVFLTLRDSRPRTRGSRRSLDDLFRLCKAAIQIWDAWEKLGWIEWKEDVLVVERMDW